MVRATARVEVHPGFHPDMLQAEAVDTAATGHGCIRETIDKIAKLCALLIRQILDISAIDDQDAAVWQTGAQALQLIHINHCSCWIIRICDEAQPSPFRRL